MSTFTRVDTKAVEDQLSTTATVEEEGTGQSSRQNQTLTLCGHLDLLSKRLIMARQC